MSFSQHPRYWSDRQVIVYQPMRSPEAETANSTVDKTTWAVPACLKAHNGRTWGKGDYSLKRLTRNPQFELI